MQLLVQIYFFKLIIIISKEMEKSARPKVRTQIYESTDSSSPRILKKIPFFFNPLKSKSPYFFFFFWEIENFGENKKKCVKIREFGPRTYKSKCFVS